MYSSDTNSCIFFLSSLIGAQFSSTPGSTACKDSLSRLSEEAGRSRVSIILEEPESGHYLEFPSCKVLEKLGSITELGEGQWKPMRHGHPRYNSSVVEREGVTLPPVLSAFKQHCSSSQITWTAPAFLLSEDEVAISLLRANSAPSIPSFCLWHLQPLLPFDYLFLIYFFFQIIEFPLKIQNKKKP